MEIYYVQCGNKVEEIRRKVKINGAIRFIIDRKESVKFVSQHDFLSVPSGFKLLKVK